MTLNAPRIVLSAVLAAFLSIGLTEFAVAQEQNKHSVVFVDYGRALRDSKAGESVRKQIDAQREKYQAEVKAAQTALENARQELEKQQAILAPEAFARKRQEYQLQFEQMQRTAQNRKRSLDQMQEQGSRQIRSALREILEGIFREREYDFVLNADPRTGTVILAREGLDITNEVIKLLDEKLPTVTVKPTE
jgi:Skp family chaperone for outer membrane proteins